LTLSQRRKWHRERGKERRERFQDCCLWPRL
jgi:hypothetical protein